MIGKDPTTTNVPQADAVSPKADANVDSVTAAKNMLSEHKGKLAIGAAATLGLMIFYNWRQKKLSEEDPEAYAAVKRVKESIKADANQAKRARGTPTTNTTQKTRQDTTSTSS